MGPGKPPYRQLHGFTTIITDTERAGAPISAMPTACEKIFVIMAAMSVPGENPLP